MINFSLQLFLLFLRFLTLYMYFGYVYELWTTVYLFSWDSKIGQRIGQTDDQTYLKSSQAPCSATSQLIVTYPDIFLPKMSTHHIWMCPLYNMTFTAVSAFPHTNVISLQLFTHPSQQFVWLPSVEPGGGITCVVGPMLNFIIFNSL